MNRDELDAWFAQADDVLDNWHGSVDAQHWSSDHNFVGREFYHYYNVEVLGDAMQRFMQSIRDAAVTISRAMQQIADALATLAPMPGTTRDVPLDWAVIIEARRHRNTGPKLHRGLDGVRRD